MTSSYKHRAEGVHVARVAVITHGEPEGRHVVHRPVPHRLGVRLAFGKVGAGDAEVQQLDRTRAGEPDVRRLHVAVNQTQRLLVGGAAGGRIECHVKGGRDLLDTFERGPQGHGATPLHDLVEVESRHELHDDRPAAVELDQSVDLYDRPMLDQGEHACFVAEALHEIRIGLRIAIQDLDRDHLGEAARPSQFGPNHGAEAAPANDLVQMVGERAFVSHGHDCTPRGRRPPANL